MATPTFVHKIEHWAKERPELAALHVKKGGAWKAISWRDYARDMRRTAKGLIALGLQPGRAAAVVGKNRPEWVISQFGIMAAGGLPTPIYETATKEQTAYIISQSGSKLVICDERAQLEKLETARREGLMNVDKIISMDELGEPAMSFDALKQLGESADEAELQRRIDGLRPENTALLIYTSGTTGFPKGAELTNRGLTMIAPAVLEGYEHLAKQCVVLSYLPLCHIAEQIFTNMLPLEVGGQVYFCPNLKEVKDYLGDVHPTVFLGVPRVWEKFQAALTARLESLTGMKAKIAGWARRTELAAFQRSVAENREVGGFSRAMANKLFISKIKAALGLDRLLLACSGSAPISVSTLEFFASLGIVIHEGFGMTETTGIATVPDYKRPVFGTVGRALPGVEIKIGEDGEILLRGDNMARKYYEKPDESAALWTSDGWMKTGDLGSLERGLLKITGRKKDLFKTAGGKYIAPAEIEQHLSGIPGVGQVVVVGERRPYPTLLVALDPDNFAALAAAAGTSPGSIAELAVDEKARAFLESWVENHCNSKLARYQTIKKVAIISEPFSVEGGQLTASMKVKRSVVEQKYAALIESLYDGGEEEPRKSGPAESRV